MSELIKVTNRQESSDDCFVCGMKNPLGFKAQFYELENKELICLVNPRFEYQSYPNRLHGGIAATLLDEVMGRAILINDANTWGVTVDMSMRYHKPTPLDETLRVVARIDKDRHIFTASGEILDENGTVLVSATGRYMKLPVDKITGVENSTSILYDVKPDREIKAVTSSGPLEIEYAD